MADDETCTGAIEEGDPLTSLCQCFAPKGLIFKPDGNSASNLRYIRHGEIEAVKTGTFHNDPAAIAHNTKGLKICNWRPKGLLYAGIKSNCNDIGVEFVMDIGQIYPLELPRNLVRKRVRYRVKYPDAEESITFPFAGSWTFNQFLLVGGVPTPQTPMTLTMTDLDVNISFEDPCLYSVDLWEAAFTDDQATNDAGFQDPTTWDPNGSRFNNLSVHADGRIGIGWRYYNTLERFGEITVGPTISATFQKVTYGGDADTPYGFSVVEYFVDDY